MCLAFAQVAAQSSSLDSALVAAIVAALVSVAGYWQTGRLNRQDRQRQLFAEAYSAARTYREFPYIIRRRLGSDDEAEITASLSTCQVEMDKYSGLLLVESATVGKAYVELISQTRRVAGAEISAAWDDPARGPGEPPHVRGVDLADLEVPDSAYLTAVRDHLSVVPVRLRKLILRRRAATR
jgi:hypothetical protein